MVEFRGGARTLILDVWQAVGLDTTLFEPFVEQHGDALVWALLLDYIRGPSGYCLDPVDDGYCCLREKHIGPCFGAADLAAPISLPWKTAKKRPYGGA